MHTHQKKRSIIFWGFTLIILLCASYVSGMGLHLHSSFFMRGGFTNAETIMNTPEGYQFVANTMKLCMLLVASYVLLAFSTASLILRKYDSAKFSLMASIGGYVLFLVWGHFGSNSAFQGQTLDLLTSNMLGVLVYVIIHGALFRYIYKYRNTSIEA